MAVPALHRADAEAGVAGLGGTILHASRWFGAIRKTDAARRPRSRAAIGNSVKVCLNQRCMQAKSHLRGTASHLPSDLKHPTLILTWLVQTVPK